MEKMIDVLNKFYYKMSLNELRLMNQDGIYPNVTYNTLLYLDLISYMEHCTVSALAKALHISKSAVTIKVNELIKQGLVQKEQSSKDKRVFYLSVSRQVEEEYRDYDERLLYAAKKLEERYGEEELELFRQMIEELNQNYLAGQTERNQHVKPKKRK